MESIFRIILLITGFLNSLPSLLAFFPGKFTKSYGIVLPNENFELLLRHRAILFGIVGGIMIYSALSKTAYEIATITGVVSMFSFVALYFLIGNITSELKKIMLIDIFATIILFTAYIIFTKYGK